MIISYKFVVVYPLLAFQPIQVEEQMNNNLIPYKPYTTTTMMQNHDIKVYEQFWNNIMKEEYINMDK